MRAVTFLHHVAQIAAVKAGDVFVGFAQFELLDDVVANLFRSAGGEGRDSDNPGNSYAANSAADTPGRNSWPHSEMQWASSIAKKETGKRCEPFDRVRTGKTLRREIEQPVLALDGPAHNR